MRVVEIWADGGCRGNGSDEAIGGYGIVLKCDDNYREVSEAFPNTTNNQMELAAVIKGLSILKEPSIVHMHSDSNYVVSAFNQGWIEKWESNGWRTANRTPVKNPELWAKLIALTKIHKVDFIKVKGHAGNKNNERCDELANNAMNKLENTVKG